MNIDNIIKSASQIKPLNNDIKIQGEFKLAYFNLIYLLIKEKSENLSMTLLSIILQFLQLLSFAFSPSFDSLWEKPRYEKISNLFHYFQLVTALEKRETLYILIFIFCSMYIIFILVYVISLSIKVVKLQLSSKKPLNLLNSLLNMNGVLFIPIMKILISIFNCNNEEHFYTNTLKCYSSTHLIFCCIGTVCSVIYFVLSIIFEITNYEYRNVTSLPSSKISSGTTIELLFAKLIIIIVYEICPTKTKITISVSTLFSILIFYRFIIYQPFYNHTVSKVYFTMYFLLFWTNIVIFFSVIFKAYIKERYFPLLFLGYFVIIINGFFGVTEFNINDFLTKEESITNPLKMLKRIKYFISLVDKLCDYTYRKENVYLFGYIKLLESFIVNQEKSLNVLLCEKELKELTPTECHNCQNLLYHHAEIMYGRAMKKFPNDIMLRISYSNFLYEKLHHKHKCLGEINILEKFDLSFEESFLVFRYKKIIKEQIELEHEGDDTENEDFVSALTFKRNVNTFKTSIIRVSKCYVDFWTLLYESDQENHRENFEKMSDLGNEIGNLINRIELYFKKIESSNMNDIECIKLYTEFLTEIIHNNEEADKYQQKLSRMENQQHKFDEKNIYHLNYRALSQNEDYKYVVASSQPERFGKIINVSLSVCSLFGFQKEDLIGRNINILIPDIFVSKHDDMLQTKLKDFIKDPQSQKRKRSKFKEYKVFGKTRAKYLIPIVLKTGLILNEEGEIFFVAQFLVELNQHQINEESCNVITNLKLQIQTFTSSAIKFLDLDSSTLNNNVEIGNYIEEFNQEYFNIELNYNGNLHSRSTEIKQKLIKKNYSTPREITWCCPQYTKGAPYLSSTRFQNTRIMTGADFQEVLAIHREKELEKEQKKQVNQKKLYHLPHNFSSGSVYGSPINSRNRFQGSVLKFREEKKLFLQVKPLKMCNETLGFIFEFVPSQIYLKNHRSQVFETLVKDIDSGKKKENPRASLIFGAIFQQIAGKKKDPFAKYRKKGNKNHIPELSRDSEVFCFDLEKFSFHPEPMSKQKSLREKLKKLAYDKVYPPAEEEEEESSEESSEETSEEEREEDTKSNYSYQTSSNVSEIGAKSETSLLKKTKTILKRFSNSDCNNIYRVNISKITLFEFDFSKGGFEKKEEETSKVCQVDFVINEYHQRLKKRKEEEENFTQKNLAKNEGQEDNKDSKNSQSKKRDSELIKPVIITEKDIIMNQMKVQLNNKDVQPSIVNLSLVTLLFFFTLTGLAIILLELILSAKKTSTKHFNLIFHTFELNQNLLFSIHTVRELTLLHIDRYTNFLKKDKKDYLKELQDEVINYFTRNRILLEEFSAIFGTVKGKEKDLISNRTLNLTLYSDKGEIHFHSLPLMSALIENNMALYNIWTGGFELQNIENSNVYYFLYNSLNEIMLGSNEASEILFRQFHSMIHGLKRTFFIFIAGNVAYFFLIFFLFNFCYDKVEYKKQNYLSVFYEIGEQLIASCLAKCEVFNHRVLIETRENPDGNLSSEGSEEEELNRILHIKKPGENHTSSKHKIKKKKKGEIKHTNFKNKIFIFSIFFFFCLTSSLIALLKINFLNRYTKIANFVNHHGMYQLIYQLIFIVVREEMFQQTSLLMTKPVKNYAHSLVINFYMENKNEYKQGLKYLYSMPEEYVTLYKGIIHDSLCDRVKDFLESYQMNCETFLYGGIKYGMKEVYTSYVEDLRSLHEKFLQREIELGNKGIVFNKYSIQYYDKLYNENDSTRDLWNNLGPVNLLNTELHKNLVIIFDNIFKEIFATSSSEMTDIVLNFHTKNHNIIVYLIYAFMIIDILTFILLIIPFEFKLNETIFKAKNMLSIIPLEILAGLSQVKIMLEIGPQNHKSKLLKINEKKDDY